MDDRENAFVSQAEQAAASLAGDASAHAAAGLSGPTVSARTASPEQAVALFPLSSSPRAPGRVAPGGGGGGHVGDGRNEGGGTEPVGLGLTAIGPLPSERAAREWSLVLQSMGTWHAIRPGLGGWCILVRDADYERATIAIERYELENRDWPPRPRRDRARHRGATFAPIVFVALAVFFLFVTGPASSGSVWFQRGSAVAEAVVGARPWRAVTALTLHTDAVHVIGNVISGSIFASAVDRRLGPGASALAVLASGIAGNVANAAWHAAMGSPGHGSIGASTAVFGAVGILAATQLVIDRSRAAGPRGFFDRVGPIAGGLALLGALGAGGARTDLGAHAFGFLAGLVVGLLAAIAVRYLGREQPRWWTQTAMGAVAASLVAGSWILAMS